MSIWATLAGRVKALAIVIIGNITKIPDGDCDIYDDPRLIENLVLHQWKNPPAAICYSSGAKRWFIVTLAETRPECEFCFTPKVVIITS